MSDASSDSACQVCGRSLLPGERPTRYVTRDGNEAAVCELCKPRAEAAGWMLPGEAAAAGAAGRDRRRSRGQMLSGLLSRIPAPQAGGATEQDGEGEATEADGERPAPRRPQRERRPARERPRERAREEEPRRERPRAAEPAGDSPGTTVPEALAAFNGSQHRRTIAGLTRTLGPPRASALAVRAANGYPGARLTVAWELTWYQWEVGPGPGGPEVRESGKGETIDQLRAADRTWNLMVDRDGTLEQRSVSAAPDAPSRA
jgi:hypothetical protein